MVRGDGLRGGTWGYVGRRGLGWWGIRGGLLGGGGTSRGGLRWVLVGGTCGEEGWYVGGGGIFCNFFKKKSETAWVQKNWY